MESWDKNLHDMNVCMTSPSYLSYFGHFGRIHPEFGVHQHGFEAGPRPKLVNGTDGGWVTQQQFGGDDLIVASSRPTNHSGFIIQQEIGHTTNGLRNGVIICNLCGLRAAKYSDNMLCFLLGLSCHPTEFCLPYHNPVLYCAVSYCTHLSAQQMEVLGRRGGVGHVHVHIVPVRRRLALATVRQLQKAFNVRTAVVRAGSVEAMGQQQDEPVLEEPFAWKNISNFDEVRKKIIENLWEFDLKNGFKGSYSSPGKNSLSPLAISVSICTWAPL